MYQQKYQQEYGLPLVFWSLSQVEGNQNFKMGASLMLSDCQRTKTRRPKPSGIYSTYQLQENAFRWNEIIFFWKFREMDLG